MHDIDPVTQFCKKCGKSKRRLYVDRINGTETGCTGKEVNEEEFVMQTAEVEPDVVVVAN